jgi:hypothetical protein
MRRKFIWLIIFLLVLLGFILVLSNRMKDENAIENIKDALSVEEAKTQVPFDAEKWSVKKGWDYPFRDMMLDDVVSNQEFRILSSNEIIELLGEPTRINEGHLYYRIAQKRLVLWPLHTKTLVIKMNEGDEVEWMKIHQ